MQGCGEVRVQKPLVERGVQLLHHGWPLLLRAPGLQKAPKVDVGAAHLVLCQRILVVQGSPHVSCHASEVPNHALHEEGCLAVCGATIPFGRPNTKNKTILDKLPEHHRCLNHWIAESSTPPFRLRQSKTHG